MRNRWMWCLVVALCGLSFLVGGVVAQEDAGGEAGMEMPAWAKPTREHADFKKAVGTWNVAMRWWNPAGESMTSSGTSVMSLAMNGFYLKQEFKGDMMGMPFEGLGYMGYDTIDKEFVSIWMDSWGPILWMGRGKEKDGVLTYDGDMPDHATGKKTPSVTTLVWDNDDRMIMVMYQILDDGTRHKHGELVYTRRK